MGEIDSEENSNGGVPEQLKYDTPYSWLVLCTVILCIFSVGGFSFGVSSVLASQYPQILNKTQQETNVIGSTTVGAFLLSVALSDVFCKKVGCRVTAAASSLAMITGVVVSAFATKFWHFIIGFSIPVGLSTSLMVVASIEVVHQYCRKLKSAGLACAGLGMSISIFILPIILRVIINTGATFREQTLYLIPLSCITLAAPIIYRPRIHHEHHSHNKVTLDTFLKPLKRCHTPVTFAQTFLWSAAMMSFFILLFTEVSIQFDEQTATTTNFLYGIGRIITAIILPLSLLKFKPNIGAIQLSINIIGGAAIIALGLVQHKFSFYVIAIIVGSTSGSCPTILIVYTHFLWNRGESNMAFAYKQAIGCIGAMTGPLTATYIRDCYGSSVTYLCLGSMHILAGVIIGINGLIRPSTMKPADARDSTNDVVEIENDVKFNDDDSDSNVSLSESRP